MPTDGQIDEMETQFERLYKTEYQGLLRYAAVTLRNHGSHYSSVSGRAEEAVQEMFAFAWENRERLFACESPAGWLYKSLYYKALESLDEDRTWTKRTMQMSERRDEGPAGNFQLRAELADLIPGEDYLLLKHLYLDGYTYQELCKELGLKKSALAMKIRRIKERFLKKYGAD